MINPPCITNGRTATVAPVQKPPYPLQATPLCGSPPHPALASNLRTPLQVSPFRDHLRTLLKAAVGPASSYLPCSYSLNAFGKTQFLNTDGILGSFLSVAHSPSPILFRLLPPSIQNYGTVFNLLFAPECTPPYFSSQ